LEDILVVAVQMLGQSVDADAANLVEFLQELETFGGAITIKGLEIGEGDPFDCLLGDNALIYFFSLRNEV
jgi:hypothetical protein